MTIFINPGSGPVQGADEAQAAYNMGFFVADLAEKGLGIPTFQRSPELDDGDGRSTFTLTWEGYKREIQMPGIPLAQVRYLGSDDQNIWDFPRLYVDGSSWVWCYALDACGPDDDD